MARIAIGGFSHETNCFVPGLTEYEDFAHPPDRAGILRGDEVLAGTARRFSLSAPAFLSSPAMKALSPLASRLTKTPPSFFFSDLWRRRFDCSRTGNTLLSAPATTSKIVI